MKKVILVSVVLLLLIAFFVPVALAQENQPNQPAYPYNDQFFQQMYNYCTGMMGMMGYYGTPPAGQNLNARFDGFGRWPGMMRGFNYYMPGFGGMGGMMY